MSKDDGGKVFKGKCEVHDLGKCNVEVSRYEREERYVPNEVTVYVFVKPPKDKHGKPTNKHGMQDFNASFRSGANPLAHVMANFTDRQVGIEPGTKTSPDTYIKQKDGRFPKVDELAKKLIAQREKDGKAEDGRVGADIDKFKEILAGPIGGYVVVEFYEDWTESEAKTVCSKRQWDLYIELAKYAIKNGMPVCCGDPDRKDQDFRKIDKFLGCFSTSKVSKTEAQTLRRMIAIDAGPRIYGCEEITDKLGLGGFFGEELPVLE